MSAAAKSLVSPSTAIDCKTDGAMFAAAVNSCNGVADLVVIGKKKSRSAPPPLLKTVSVLDLTKHGGYRARKLLYRGLCGGFIEAAELYLEILDLWQQKDGKPRVKNIRHSKMEGVGRCYWWGRSRADWAKKMGWTDKQTKYRFAQLRELGLIETVMAKTPKHVLQVRPVVAEGAASLNGFPDASNTHFRQQQPDAQTLTGRASQPENWPQAIGEKLTVGHWSKIDRLKALGLREVGLREVDKDLAGEQPPATAAHPGQNKNEPGKDKPQTEDQNLEPSQTQDQTQKSKPSLVLVKQGSAVAQSSCSSNPLIDAWITGMRGLGKHAQLTRIERAKVIHNFGQAATAAGVDGACVIRWALSKNVWWNIGVRLHVEHGVDQPAPALFALTTAKFSNVIFDCYEAHLKAERDAAAQAARAEAAAALRALQAAQTVVAKPPPPPVEFPTEQQILADIAELVAQQKPKG